MGRWAKFTRWMFRRPAGGAAGAFAVMDELFHPSSREALIAASEREEAIAPMPSPEGQPVAGATKFGGRITITIAAEVESGLVRGTLSVSSNG